MFFFSFRLYQFNWGIVLDNFNNDVINYICIFEIEIYRILKYLFYGYICKYNYLSKEMYVLIYQLCQLICIGIFMYVNIFSYLWDIKVFLKKNLFLLNFFVTKNGTFQIFDCVFKMKSLYEWLKFCVYVCIFFI